MQKASWVKKKSYAEERFEEMKEGDEDKKVLEVVGELYCDLKSKLIEGMEECGLHIKSWTEDSSSDVKHVVCGPDAFEVVSNQERFIEALSQESLHKISIPRRSEHNRTRFVPNGSALCWEFTVESGDIEFSLKKRVKMEDHQVIHQTIIDKQKFQGGKKIQGFCQMDQDSTLILLWDNSFSLSNPKELDFRMTVVKKI